MKRNVDLTEDRFFSSSNWFNDIAMGVLTLSMLTKEKFPWNAYLKQVHSEDDLGVDDQRKSIVIVGDKETRAKVKQYRQMNGVDYCDCCGKRMNLKPWDRETGVCHSCNDHYQGKQDKCKWRKKEEIRNAVIRTA